MTRRRTGCGRNRSVNRGGCDDEETQTLVAVVRDAGLGGRRGHQPRAGRRCGTAGTGAGTRRGASLGDARGREGAGLQGACRPRLAGVRRGGRGLPWQRAARLVVTDHARGDTRRRGVGGAAGGRWPRHEARQPAARGHRRLRGSRRNPRSWRRCRCTRAWC